MAVLLAGTFTAFLTLGIIARGGGLNPDSVSKAIKYLLEFYLPLLGVVSAFYLAGTGPQVQQALKARLPEAALLAVLIILGWSALPTLTLALSGTYEAAFRVLDSFKIYGSTLSSTAIAFVYAKSA
jgi:hypothetical protein